jgi:hypothetical protein
MIAAPTQTKSGVEIEYGTPKKGTKMITPPRIDMIFFFDMY